MKRFYLGVDGGQSSTTALIADETGAVLGQGRGGPCNHVTGAEAREKFNQVIGACLEVACRQAGLKAESVRFAAVCLGFSGGAEDKQALTEALIQSDCYYITHDAEIALTGATAGEPGIIVIAGTGSMAFGRNRNSDSARAGGWGYIYGDEGGAFDIVRQALRAALRAEEGWGPATSLSARLLQIAGVSSADAVLHAFYTSDYPRSKVASYAQLVNQEAIAGDEVAMRILRSSGRQLAQLVGGVYKQLFRPAEPVPIVPIGGAFASAILHESFAEQVKVDLDCSVREARWSPAAGALLQALQMGGNTALPRGADLLTK